MRKSSILIYLGMVNGGGGKEFDEMLVLVVKNPKHMVLLLGTYLKVQDSSWYPFTLIEADL
jgi:hypothetical protein